jgi:sirohydrochlorin ferrochelatase
MPAGRHRRPVPAALPPGAPALVLAVPSTDPEALSGTTADLAAVLSIDNPALDVRTARIDGGGRSDPTGIRAVLADAAARRPAGVPAAVVVPLLAGPHPAVYRTLREAIVASEAKVTIAEPVNTNSLLAEALHIRLAEAGLARADRVRLFSIATSADGIIIATVGGPHGVASANVTAVLLAARLALPVLAASLDGEPGIAATAARLREMGARRLAIAPCLIGPEATAHDLDAARLSIDADCAAPLGTHGNVIKLITLAYGQALAELDMPDQTLERRGWHASILPSHVPGPADL